MMKTVASIVVPVYQNEESLEETIFCLLSLQEQLPNYSLELVLVDDGSTDSSLEIMTRLAEENPGVVAAIKLTRNFGQSPAIQAGLEAARGSWIVIISADLQEPYQAIPELVSKWEKGAKYVIGERETRKEAYVHQMLSGIYWWLIRKFAFDKFPKMGYDFCLVDHKIRTEIIKTREKNTSIFALIYWLGYKPAIVYIDRSRRRHGKSQWTMRKKLKFTVDTLIGFSNAPARFITLSALTAVFVAGGYLVFLMALWFFSDTAPPGWMTLTALILIFGSLILLALGIACEYLLRILDATRHRPLAVVEQIIGRDSSEANPKNLNAGNTECDQNNTSL